MSILHKRQKIRARAVERNKGEGRELPLECRPAHSRSRKQLPLEHERASVREARLAAKSA
ncbi:MAG: hypothetical protein M3Y79_11985 [Pseudomonadota bacterium]|nr:hypothetical protein [Pseudomonadota bacterium]